LSEDMEPKFSENFKEILLEPLIQSLDDPVPRVSAHSAAALTNFLENVPKEYAISVSPKLIPRLLNLVNIGISI